MSTLHSLYYMSFVSNTINLNLELFLLHIWCNCCVKQLCSLRWLSDVTFSFFSCFFFGSYNDYHFNGILISGHQIFFLFFERMENNIHFSGLRCLNLFYLNQIYLFVKSNFRKLLFLQKKKHFFCWFLSLMKLENILLLSEYQSCNYKEII